MNDSANQDLPEQNIKAKSPLTLTLIKGNEGIGTTYLTKLTYQDFVDHFENESEEIDPRDKLQREADAPRIREIYSYLTERDNTIFPSACLVVTELEVKTLLTTNLEIVEGVIPVSASSITIDGQGRNGGIRLALKEKPSLANLHLDVKIVVVPTKTILESKNFVTQIFSDFHLGLKKPNTSQNIYFDNELSSSRLAKEVLDITAKLGVPFDKAIAVNGKIKHGQLYTLANLTQFISVIVGESSKKSLNSFLEDADKYTLYLTLTCQYIVALYNHLPFGAIQDEKDPTKWKDALNSNILTCAIGFKALAYLGRSLIDNALVNEETELNTSSLALIKDMPITDRGDKLWIDKQIYQNIEGKIKIVKSSEKRLARLMCHRLRVLPCNELS